MSIQFINESEIKAAINDVRNDSTPTDWVLLGYESPKSSNFVLLGSGTGGANELATHLEPSMVGFGLVRKTDRIDDSETVKFAFVNFIGDRVGILQKGRISVHVSAVKQFVGQSHVDIAAATPDEVTDVIVMQKIQDTSGTRTRVLDGSGSRPSAGSPSSSSRSAGSVKSSSAPKSSEHLSISNESEYKNILKELRTGGESGINWVLFGYEGGDSNTITLLGQGHGGVEELASHLNDKLVGYGLVKEIEKIDESNTVKFAYINWIGEEIPRMLRARLGTHSGAIKDFLGSYHVDIKATQKDEVTSEVVRHTIKRAAGTADHVLKSTSSSGGSGSSGSQYRSGISQSSKSNSQKAGSVPGGKEANVRFLDESEVKAALKDVRSDSSDTDWALVVYDGPNSNNLILSGKGNGGISELSDRLDNDIVGYALLRETERIDESLTVKFVFIDWTGENINRMLRARLGTHSGAVKEMFAPYHVDLHTSDKPEVSEEHIRGIIKKAAGTGNYVR